MTLSPALDGVQAAWDLLDERRPLFWFQDWNRSIDPAGLVDDACAASAPVIREADDGRSTFR